MVHGTMSISGHGNAIPHTALRRRTAASVAWPAQGTQAWTECIATAVALLLFEPHSGLENVGALPARCFQFCFQQFDLSLLDGDAELRDLSPIQLGEVF